MTNAKIGTPVFKGAQKDKPKKVYFKIQAGSNQYRLLPPFGDLADAGTWYVKHAIHFGYMGSPNAEGEAKQRAFKCVEEVAWNNRKPTVTQVCPECELIAKVKLEVDVRTAALKNKGVSEAKIAEDEEIVNNLAFLESHNREVKFYLNAMNSEGEIGLLKLPSSCVKGVKGNGGLENAIKTLQDDYGISNPLAAEDGVWFDFKKKGAGRFGTTYETVFMTEKVITNGKSSVSPKQSALSDAVLERMQTEAFELNKVVTEITLEDVQTLVDTQGDPEQVDAIFAKGRTAV